MSYRRLRRFPGCQSVQQREVYAESVVWAGRGYRLALAWNHGGGLEAGHVWYVLLATDQAGTMVCRVPFANTRSCPSVADAVEAYEAEAGRLGRAMLGPLSEYQHRAERRGALLVAAAGVWPPGKPATRPVDAGSRYEPAPQPAAQAELEF